MIDLDLVRPGTSGGNFLPPVDDTYDLGSTTLGWNNLYLADDGGVILGSDQDIYLYHQSTAIAADEGDTDLAALFKGTSDHQAITANSLLISNTIASGNIGVYVNTGGNTLEALLIDASAADWHLGFGLTGDGAVYAGSGNSFDVYIAQAKEIDYSTGALAFQQATTISVTTGVMAFDGASGSQVKMNEAGADVDFVVESKDIVNFFIVDAALNAMGIAGAALSQSLLTINATPNSANNVSATANGLAILIGGGTWYLANPSETLAVGALISIPAHTLQNDTATLTYTNYAQLYIGGVATGGTNVTLTNAGYGFWSVPSIRLDSSLWVESTPDEGTSGEQLTSGGTGAVMTWAAAGSMPQFKNLQGRLLPEDAYRRILAVESWQFTYREQVEGGGRAITTKDYDTLYAGVLATDFPEVMHHDGQIFSPVSAFGYTVESFHAVEHRLTALTNDNVVLRAEVARLRNLVEV